MIDWYFPRTEEDFCEEIRDWIQYIRDCAIAYNGGGDES